MKRLSQKLQKFFSIFSGLSLVFNSILPSATLPLLFAAPAYAQEVTPTATVAPTPEITPEVTPEPTVVPTVTEEVTPSPAPENLTPTPTEVAQPTETGPPAGGQILDGASTETPAPTDTATLTPTPTITPEVTEEGQLAALILENVDAESLDLDSVDPSNSATLTTDKADYAPTDTAIISGTGFKPNHTYDLTIKSDDPPATSTTVEITTDGQGTFIYAYQLDGIYRPNYQVIVTNKGGHVIATTTFTDNIGFNKAVYRTDNNTWTTGNAGNAYQEGQWAFYTYSVTDVNSTNVPSFNVVFNFHQSSSNAIFVDAFTNFRYCWDCSALPDGTSNPPVSTTTWHTWIPANINKEYSGSSCLATNDTEPAADEHCFRVTGGSMFPTDAPGSGSHTLRIFFEAHLARSYDWAGGFESQLSTAGPHLITAPPESVTPVYGADVYTGWFGTYLGIGSATGSSRHFNLQDQSAGPGGAQTLPIPGVPAATGSITVTKVTDPTPAAGVTFGFTGDFGAFNLDTDPGTGTSNTTTFSNLAQGTFVVSEGTLSGGWSLTNLVCTNTTGNSTFSYNGPAATVNLAQGGLVTCTYTNTLQQGTIELKKVWVGTGGQTTLNIGTSPSGSQTDTQLTGTAGAAPLTTGQNTVNAGTYYVSETGGLTNYSSSLSCFNDVNNNGTNDSEPAVTPGGSNSVAVASSAHVICTFTNTRINNGSITIIKDAQPDNSQDFGFTTTGSGLSSFTLDDDANPTLSNTATFSGIAAGTYTVSETATAGWTLGSIVCTDPTQNSTSGLPNAPTATINLAAGENVTCTFTNTLNKGNIKVNKLLDADGNGSFETTNPGTFTWTFGATGPYAMGTTQSGFTSGLFSLSENTVANYHLVGWYRNSGQGSCASPDSTTLPASIEILTNQTVEITICNAADTGTVELKKVWSGTAGQTTLNIGTSNGGTQTDTQLTGVAGAAPLTTGQNTVVTGTYYVSETGGLTDYTSALSCFNDADNNGANNGEASVTVGANNSVAVTTGQHVICTFTNTLKNGTMILKKVMVGGTDSFDFTGSPSGTINTNNGTVTVNNVTPGTYTSAESAKTGWTLDSISCNDPNSATPSTVNLGGRSSTFKVDPGETVTCTFTNSKKPTLSIYKVCNPTGDTGTFNLQIDSTNVTTGTICGGWTNGAIEVSIGSHTVGETGGSLSNYTSVISGDCAANGTVSLAAGENKSCTITNTRNTGTIVVHKDVQGPTGQNVTDTSHTFDVTLDNGTNHDITDNGTVTFTSVPTGNHSVKESVVDSHYDLYGISLAAGGSGNTSGLTVSVTTGQTTHVYVTNRQHYGEITVHKLVDRQDDGTFEDSDPVDFTWKIDGSGTYVMGSTQDTVAPGIHTVGENSPSGYHFVGWFPTGQGEWSCTNLPANTENTNYHLLPLTVNVGPDGQSNFTFCNARDTGDLRVNKVADTEGDGQYESVNPIEFKWGTESALLASTDMGTGQTLLTGNYNVYENEVPGYQFTGWFPGGPNQDTEFPVTCDNLPEGEQYQSLPAAVDVVLDQTTEITLCNKFLNPILTITKENNTGGGDKHPGDSVLFTLTVTATQSAAFNVEVTDLPAGGFTYQPGSWTSNSSVRGDLKTLGMTTEPTYASPGVWQLGDMIVDEVVTLTYAANISGDQQAGLYFDLAWAEGCKTDATCNVGDSLHVLSSATNPGFIADNYVGTQVNVILEPSQGVNLKVEGQVLGASTELPATGAQTFWLYVALALVTGGLTFGGLGWFLRRKYA